MGLPEQGPPPPVGALCQIEIQVRDLDKAAAFYHQVFGWQAVPAVMHNYLILDGGSDQGFGISLVPNPSLQGQGSQLTLYWACDDPEAIVAKALAWGGRLLVRHKTLFAYGTISLIADPDGQRFGLFKRASKPLGEGTLSAELPAGSGD